MDPVGHFDAATGGASVSGTVSCDASAEYAYIDLELTQRVGRLLIRGFGGAEVTCTGEPEPWTAFVIGENGTFKGGKSVGVALAVACRFDDCGELRHRAGGSTQRQEALIRRWAIRSRRSR